MEESDDDFKELCASFFQRVKKNAPKEASGERTRRKASGHTQNRGKRKEASQAVARSKALQGPSEKKPRLGSQTPRTKKQGAPKSQEGDPALPENGKGGVLAPTPDQPVLCERAQSIQTESAPNGDSQPLPSCFTTTGVPSPSKPRASELVLQRMKQFKRADPERLRHASEESSLKTALGENAPRSPHKEIVVENEYNPKLPATDSDAAVALALQQEFKREEASSRHDGLEEKGLFFCQMCQKNLSAMNVTRREQHVNRCLDEAEKALRPAPPQIPDCPICGKPFLTTKSRISHLKQCAVRMEVGPQLLLQAVRLQTAQPEVGGSPQVPSFSNHVGGLKQRGGTTKREPQRRWKVNKPEAPSEDLLVAMALSRSETEHCPAVPPLRLENAFSEKIRLGAEKKSRRKRPPVCPPQLVTQDSETTSRQIEDRVAQLLAEEIEPSCTPPLPASKILKEELEHAGWRVQLPEGKQNFLWELSALTRAWAKESFYTVGLLPPVVSQCPTKEPELLPELPKQREPSSQRPPASQSSLPVSHSPKNQLLSSSQRERQALQDLVDLAVEGLSSSPWPRSLGVPTGLDLVPSTLPLTGFVLPCKKTPKKDDSASLSLGLLVTDFGAMVNSPHLSDVQLQLDSGEVLYAHKFVLYARCPLLLQCVNTEGFSAVEDGDLTQRFLLSDVSSEAAHAFLKYLYMADTDVPPSLAPGLHSLALRFGVSDLVQLCEQVPAMADLEGEQPEASEDCKSRAETFQELLRSVWADEEEGAETPLEPAVCEEDGEKVNEAEMEEIYEFAATQRKLLQGDRAADTDGSTDQCREDGPVSEPSLAGVQSDRHPENTEQMELSGLEKEEALASYKHKGDSTPLQDQCPEWAGKAEAQDALGDAVDHPNFCSPSDSHKGRGKDCLPLHPHKAYDCKHLLPTSQRVSSELSQITVDHEEQNDWLREGQADVAQAPSPHPCCLLSQTSVGGSPSQSWLHLYHTSRLSPSVSQSHGSISKVVSPPSSLSPVTPTKQTRDSNILMLRKEAGQHKSKPSSPVSGRRSGGILISPARSPPIDLTQSVPDPPCPRAQGALHHGKEEDEVILLLDSDEERELEHTKTESVSKDFPEGRKLPEVSPRSSELFSVIDVEEDQEHFQSPLKTEARLQQGEEGPLGNQSALGRRDIPWLFCNQKASLDEDSATDTSWLVPATPGASKSRDCSSQTQIKSLKIRTLSDEPAQQTPRPNLERRTVLEAAQQFSVIMPHTQPVTLGASDSRRQAYRSPSLSYPGRHRLSSSQPLCPPPEFTRWSQKSSSPRPCLPNPPAADEVVEVGDSDDEQEVASHQGNSSPVLDGDPPGPLGDYCWHEPLSPIPIDHLNLERTGPLITSSPSSQVQEALPSDGCHSPGLGTTPIRGSYGALTESPKQSSQAGSPESSKLSVLSQALWDDWDEEEGHSTEAPPVAQMLSARTRKPDRPETPSANQKKNLPPKVPITPMPRYSIMETPVLKKELDRFGVRALPKRQMVLKLKEIFQYTHQTLESDSEDELPSSQIPPEVPCSQASTAETCNLSRSGSYTQLKATEGLGTRGFKGPTRSKSLQRQGKQLSENVSHSSRLPATEPSHPDGDALLPDSQESMATSVDGSDNSFSSQSSSGEFGAALESAGEDKDEEDGLTASQVAIQAADTEEAVRRYICSKPALHRKVLLYQPLELAELQAELKQHGIPVAMGKLLDILDAQCITFTTAAARKEKLKQKRRQPAGRKKKHQK
ncbi:structure-specific endonuclease subunit SLX4 isoform X2 [Grammomys surdaster]|uniref:structure-specific endonuclease subunit SLX4 isoform X2 n=1 Tax=Grammomys surdaster TaxID=491861 RepID=UPI00109F56FA|nr:structure-specific endonuclease subunit SLX4 isoform X2 [Grammomys surdaster]